MARDTARATAKVTTRTGDTGYTSLLGKARVAKDDPRIEALGALDEAQSALGLGRASSVKPRTRELARNLQRDLYICMAELATPAENYDKVDFKIHSEDVLRLETLEEELKARVAIDTSFVIPGDTPGGAALDFARAVVRRGERRVATLLHKGIIKNQELLRYLNRLSDLVFILARYEEAAAE